MFIKRGNKKIFDLDDKIAEIKDKQFALISRNINADEISNHSFFKLGFLNKTIYTTSSNINQINNSLLFDKNGQQFMA